MQLSTENIPSPLALLAEGIYRDIVRQFPVCCASDEFYFFPQVVVEGPARWGWDDLTPEAVSAFLFLATKWATDLRQFREESASLADQVDIDQLLSLLQNLGEQLQQVVPQQQKPTFHLSIVVAGLVEALEAGDSAAWAQRIAELPEFLHRATRCLDRVPQLFLTLGQQMLADLQTWFAELQQAGYRLGSGSKALSQFAENLSRCPTQERFVLSLELFERLLSEHLGCAGDLESIERELREEYAEMAVILKAEAERLTPGQTWQQAGSQLPFSVAPAADLRQLYRPELQRLEDHCRLAGLVPQLAGELQPQLAPVPASMAAIRASDAYSARVGHPASGGTFYLFDHSESPAGRVGRTLEYRMTSAHEVWPGHHLLDVCRWNLSRPIRRPLERPLFYEGWACYAEHLLAETGYFNGPWDRFLLARRRIERAARGLVDIGLQSGQIGLAEAIQQLVRVGYSQHKAAAAVPKYTLRPGYQVCYTLGLKQMIKLREASAELETSRFAQQVLTQGEISFTALRQVLLNRGD